MTDNCRIAFEEWIKLGNESLRLAADGRTYWSVNTEDMWEAWQACWKLRDEM